MARLWRNQGKRDEARELLAPVCGWFTEGFETRDVKEAKALLFAMRRPTAFRQCEMTLMTPLTTGRILAAGCRFRGATDMAGPAACPTPFALREQEAAVPSKSGCSIATSMITSRAA